MEHDTSYKTVKVWEQKRAQNIVSYIYTLTSAPVRIDDFPPFNKDKYQRNTKSVSGAIILMPNRNTCR